ncbi:MAG: FGGY family carbohydrate kinase [Anaerolineae bacterium]
MSESFVVASDLGSGSCKTVILNEQGRAISRAQQEYPTAYPRLGWVEQNPEDWYGAFCTTVRAALQKSGVDTGQIRAVGIVGVTHNTVLLDANDKPLCPSILLFDTRSTAEVQAILEKWGDRVLERTLNDITPVWSWPQLLWIRNHMPEVWRETRRLLFQKDYVRHRLAPSPITDIIDAGGSLLFDPVAGQWIPEFCDDLGIDPAWLPEAKHPLQVVSQVSQQGAADTGLHPGTPVITGTTDTVAEMLGSGAISTGTACVKLASVGRIAVVTDEPVRQQHILNYRHVLGDLWYPGTASKSAASTFRWLRDLLWPELNHSISYKLMDEAAAQIPPGSDGIIFHPHLMGEWAPYWDEKMRADFLGLTARHSRGHLTRAVLEGVAFALKDALSELESLNVHAEDIRLIGQGSNSPLWSSIVANVLDRPLAIPAQPDAAFGSALITAMGVGIVAQTPDALEAMITIRERIEPSPEATQDYAALYTIYRDADTALRGISSRLHDFEHRKQRTREQALEQDRL